MFADSSLTASLAPNAAGRPTTHNDPRIGPTIVPIPPMIVIATRRSEAAGENGLLSPVTVKPGRRNT